MTGLLLITMMVAALVVLVIAIEAIRTGRWEFREDGAAEYIPDSFYSENSLLPDVLLDSAGWIGAAGIVWIVIAALLMPLPVGTNSQKQSRDDDPSH